MKIMTILKNIMPLLAIGITPCFSESTFNPMGYWLTELSPGKNGESIHEAKVQIYNCGDKICGKIFSLKEPIDKKTGKPPLDVNNPDPKKHVTPIIGMPFIFDMAPDKDDTNKWSGGTIYNADDGRSYTAYLSMTSNDILYLRGFVLGMPFLGKTTEWIRTTKDAKF